MINDKLMDTSSTTYPMKEETRIGVSVNDPALDKWREQNCHVIIKLLARVLPTIDQFLYCQVSRSIARWIEHAASIDRNICSGSLASSN